MRRYFYEVYDHDEGVHGVPLYRIAGYALNNTATNLYLFLFNYVVYVLTGPIGVATSLIATFQLTMRIWDGVTDPIIGYVVDRTNSRFGKNRPFMLIGNLILLATSAVIYFLVPQIPDKFAYLRFPAFIAVAIVYYIGYTFQCVVTKSAQSCVTNDPEQRPMFSVFDSIYNLVIFTGGPILVTNYLIPKYGEAKNLALHHELWCIVAPLSLLFTILSIISIWPKDKQKYFGTGKHEKIGIKDYIDVLAHNRAIQMLVVAASTDKLAAQGQTGVMPIILFGIAIGNIQLNGPYSLILGIFSAIMVVFGMKFASKMGQMKALIGGSYGVIIFNILIIALWKFSDFRSFNFPGFDGFKGFTFFTIAFIVLSCLSKGAQSISGGIVIPMTADCADYETYRSGKYVPGLIGTIFSCVDKLISSLGPFIATLMLAMIGFTHTLPDVDTPYSEPLLNVALFCMYGLLILGSICNIIAMKFYPLNKEKMSEIQSKISSLKASYYEETNDEFIG